MAAAFRATLLRNLLLSTLALSTLTAAAAAAEADIGSVEADSGSADANKGPADENNGSDGLLPQTPSSYRKLYDVAVVTQLPGRSHALRLLASLLASATATNAFGDARHVFIVVNTNYNEANPLHRSNLLQNLNVGRCSVHFLPEYYRSQQCSGALYAMELFLRQESTRLHGLLVVEDDIVFGPDFDQHLAHALTQSDALERTRLEGKGELAYLLRMYATSQDVYTDEAFPNLEDAIHDRVARRVLKVMPLEQWEQVHVRAEAAGGLGGGDALSSGRCRRRHVSVSFRPLLR